MPVIGKHSLNRHSLLMVFPRGVQGEGLFRVALLFREKKIESSQGVLSPPSSSTIDTGYKHIHMTLAIRPPHPWPADPQG
jgi:hypothetical protein